MLVLVCVLAAPHTTRPTTGPFSIQEQQISHDRNAAWLGIEWVNEPVGESAVRALAADLEQYGIRTVYVYTTYMRGDKTFGATYAHAPSFVRHLKDAYPEVMVQAWIGLPLKLLVPGLWAKIHDKDSLSGQGDHDTVPKP